MSTEAPNETVDSPAGEPEADGGEVADARRNERSAISFPYSALEDAEAVARAVHAWGGREVGQDRIAANLNTTVKSSGFRTDVAAARIFGVIDGRGTVSLTPLGHELVDDQTAARARVEAFKNVPLFNALFKEHQGKVLPGSRGIEAEMLRLGVSPKQVSRARQIFQRSAQHAGFFNHSPERLVEPLTTGASAPGGKKGSSGNGESSTVTTSGGQLPPEVVILIERLLLEGENWPDEAQRLALQSARMALKAHAAIPKP